MPLFTRESHTTVSFSPLFAYALARTYHLLKPCLDSAGGQAWWHTSANDSRRHVTVRFLGLNRPTRAHVYENGTASIRPSRATRDAAEEDDGNESPFSDEEVEAGGKAAED